MLKYDGYRTGISDTPLCDCGMAVETIEHFLLYCRKYDTERQDDGLHRGHWIWFFHRIHGRQHVTDDAGISKHRLSPYYAYYHNDSL